MLQYLSHFPVVFASSTPIITVLCNRQSVIDCILTREQAKHILLGETIQDDYDVYNEIAHTMQCLQPVTLWFIHVKGHQERKKTPRLSLQVQLNIECDKQASTYLQVAHTKPPKPNPTLPNSYLHHGVTIV